MRVQSLLGPKSLKSMRGGEKGAIHLILSREGTNCQPMWQWIRDSEAGKGDVNERDCGRGITVYGVEIEGGVALE